MCITDSNTSTVSEARLRANRLNAQKSTGPRTPQGKSRSSRNATTHALSASLPQTIVPEDEQAEYESFSATFLDALNPQGPLELLLCQRLLLRAYQLHRCHTAESHLLSQDRTTHAARANRDYQQDLDEFNRRSRAWKNPPTTPPEPPVIPSSAHFLAQSFHKDSSPITRLQRYATTADLAFHRDLKQLLTLQKLRASQPPPDDDTPESPNEPNPDRSTAVPAVLTTPIQNKPTCQLGTTNPPVHPTNNEMPLPIEPTPKARDAGVSPAQCAQPLTSPPIQNEPNTPPPSPSSSVSSVPSVPPPSPHSLIAS